jgi:hypothetical protein
LKFANCRDKVAYNSVKVEEEPEERVGDVRLKDSIIVATELDSVILSTPPSEAIVVESEVKGDQGLSES